MTHLFTAGYQGESISGFINKIKSYNIDAVIDIRENPISRKPGFSKGKLAKHLRSSNIQYLHFKELGTPKPLRHFLADQQDYQIFFEEYKAFLPEFRDTIDDIVEIGANKKICLLCFEKDPHYCHRQVVAELIKEYAGKEVKVIHL